MTNVPSGWRYSIKYGPEGEANYAFVYDDKGHLVSNLRTHHAEEVVAAMNAISAMKAECAECIEVLRGFILDAHERTPKGEKWRISGSLFRDMMALLSKLEAKS